MPSSSHHHDFSHALRVARLRAGMSQAALASAVGRSSSAIRRWEQGEGVPADDVVEELAVALGTDSAQLLHAIHGPERKVVVSAPAGDVPLPDDADGEGEEESRSQPARPPRPEQVDTSGKPWIEVPTEPVVVPPVVPPAAPATPSPAEETAPARSAMPVAAPVAVAPPPVVVEPPSYLDRPGTRSLYTIRLVVTLLLLAAGVVVLVWAFGELFEALGAVVDLFQEPPTTTIPGIS